MSNLNKVSSNPNQQRARGYSAPKTGKIVDKSVSSRDILLQHFKGIGNQNRSSKTPTPMVRPIEGPGVFSIDLRQRSNEMSGYKDLENSVNVIVEESPEKSSKETPITNTEGFFTFRGKESCVMLKEEMKYEDIPIITVEDEIRKEIVGDVNLGNNDLCDAKANIVTKMDQDALKSDKLTQRVIVNTEKVIDTPNDHKKNAADVELSPEIIFESRTLLDFKNQDIQIIEKESTAPSQKPIEKRNLNVEKSIDLSVSASNIKTSPKLSSSPQNLPTAQDKTKINANKRNFESSPTQSILSFDQFMSQIDPKASYRSTSSMSNSYYNQSPKANTQSISSNQSKPITKYEQIKQQALEKEKIMVKRKKSVIKIQALVRGWICRKRVSVIKKRYLESQRRVKIRAVAERIKRSWAPYVILNGLRK